MFRVWVMFRICKHTVREICTAENERPSPTALIVEVRNPVRGADEGQISVIAVDVVVVCHLFLETAGPRYVTLWPVAIVEEEVAGNIRTTMEGPGVGLNGEVVHNLTENVQLGTYDVQAGTL
jgi:hypothetical protein